MRWGDLVVKVSERSGVGPRQTRAVLAALIREVLAALKRGEEVSVPGIVKIDARWQEARTVRSVKDRRRVAIDGRYVPRLRAGTKVKRVLLSRTPQTWRDPAHQAAWQLAEALIGDLELYHGKRVPSDLTASMDSGEIEARCAEAFGTVWEMVRTTFDDAVAEPIRSQQPHLPTAARRRWASP